MTDWDELSPLEIDNQRLRADCTKLETAHGQNMREIDRLRAELAALKDVFRSKKFRSGCVCHIDDDTETVVELCDLHREREDTLRAELAATRAALEPFAAVYKYDIGGDEADEDYFVPMTKHNRTARLRILHFQRAYAAWFKGGGDE